MKSSSSSSSSEKTPELGIPEAVALSGESNFSNLSWFDLARGYFRHQVGGHQGEMGQRLCNYIEQGVTSISGAPSPTTPQLLPLEFNEVSSSSTKSCGIDDSVITGSCNQSLSKIPVPVSEYTKTLIEKLDENKNIQLSEEAKADADLEALASSYKNNIQYERELLTTKHDFCTSNLKALHAIVFRETHSQPEITTCEDVTLDKITRHINVLKSKRNNQTNEDTTLAAELGTDLDRFKALIATLSKAERTQHTTLIASIGKTIRKMEILTPLLDAYIFIFLIRNSTNSDRSFQHINDLLVFLADHSTQLRLEPELTSLIEITVHTKLISEVHKCTAYVVHGLSMLDWTSTLKTAAHNKATQMFTTAVATQTKIIIVQSAANEADMSWIEDLQRTYGEACTKLDHAIISFDKAIQHASEVNKKVRHSMVVPVMVGMVYFVSGFMQGR